VIKLYGKEEKLIGLKNVLYSLYVPIIGIVTEGISIK